MALATTSEQGRHLILPMPNTAFSFADVSIQLFGHPKTGMSPCKASLTGQRMPTLEWPDTACGPWSGAGKQTRMVDQQRRDAIARWLQEESEDDEEMATFTSVSSSSLYPSARHPMVAKAVMDRKRKEMLLVSALSTPSLTNSSGATSSSPSSSSRKPKSSRRARRRQQGGDDTFIESPSARKHKMRKIRHVALEASALATCGIALPITPLRPSSYKPKGRKNRSRKTDGGASDDSIAHVGCQCGISPEDKSTPMIQCNGCTSWYHLRCVGFDSTEQAPAEEEGWFCLMCCEMASTMLTPGSLSSGLSVTPIFPRSAILAGQQVRLSQGQLPVFAQPIETPPHFHRDEGHAHPFSSALALAPSPNLYSGSSSSLHRASTSSAAAGRARASRVGWHLAEPGSPLQHKGGAIGADSSPNGRQWRGTFAGVNAQLMAGSHDGESTFGGLGSVDSGLVKSAAEAYLRTPSPRLMPAAAPSSTVKHSRQPSASALTNGAAALRSQHQRRESHNQTVRDFEDIFSTPSRVLSGSASWGQAASSGAGLRHSRQPSIASMAGTHSTPWGLSTPTRHLMDAGFQSDYSAGGLPSLVHSSGGLDAGEFAGWHHLQMSPSSTTRAASRARQQSANGRRMSSVRHPLTPERVGGGSGTFDANSSSPFPKTPTFDMYHQRHRFGVGQLDEDENDQIMFGDEEEDDEDDYNLLRSATKGRTSISAAASRRMSSLSHAAVLRSPNFVSPSTSHTRTFAGNSNKHAGNEIGGGGLQSAAEIKSARQHVGNKARARNVSGDLMTGLGIGLELNDVLEWAT